MAEDYEEPKNESEFPAQEANADPKDTEEPVGVGARVLRKTRSRDPTISQTSIKSR